jgi:AraC-like DNA-binding protein
LPIKLSAARATVTDVARRVGYRQPSPFVRALRGRYGLTPPGPERELNEGEAMSPILPARLQSEQDTRIATPSGAAALAPRFALAVFAATFAAFWLQNGRADRLAFVAIILRRDTLRKTAQPNVNQARRDVGGAATPALPTHREPVS